MKQKCEWDKVPEALVAKGSLVVLSKLLLLWNDFGSLLDHTHIYVVDGMKNLGQIQGIKQKCFQKFDIQEVQGKADWFN